MCALGKSHPTTCRYGWTSILRPLISRLLAAALEPTFQINQRHRPFVVVGAAEGVVVKRLDPTIFATGTVAAERQPHQAACGLPGHVLALEEHVAQNRLGAAIALGRGELKPACRLAR